METNTISQPRMSASTDLKLRIMKLNYRAAEQEKMLKDDLERFKYSLRPSTIIKRTFTDLKNDSEFRQSAMKKVLGVGAGFLLNGVLKSTLGFKKHLLMTGAKKLVSFVMNKARG